MEEVYERETPLIGAMLEDIEREGQALTAAEQEIGELFLSHATLVIPHPICSHFLSYRCLHLSPPLPRLSPLVLPQ